LIFFGSEIKDARFVRWQDNFDWLEGETLSGALFFSEILYKSASETVHDSVRRIIFVSVAIELVPHDDCPVGLETICTGLQVAFSFKLALIIVFV
jgi:hypothetical protein